MKGALLAFLLLLALPAVEAQDENSLNTWYADDGDNEATLGFELSLEQDEKVRRLSWYKINTSGGLITLATAVSNWNYFNPSHHFQGRVGRQRVEEMIILHNVSLSDAGNYTLVVSVNSPKQGDYRVERHGHLLVRKCSWRSPCTWYATVAGTALLNFSFSLNTNETAEAIVWYRWDGEQNVTMATYNSTSDLLQASASYEGRVNMTDRPGELLLYNISAKDAGKYGCSFFLPNGEQAMKGFRKNGTLVLTASPVVTILHSGSRATSTVRVRENSPLNLTCYVTGALPPVPDHGYTWTFSSSNKTTSQLPSNKSMLLIPKVKKNDTGRYTCLANNSTTLQESIPVGRASVDVRVMYLHDVKVTRTSGQLTVVTGEEVTLTCSADSFPVGNMTWLLNGKARRRVSTNMDNFTFTVQDCSDVVQCHVSNEEAGVEKTEKANLSIECPPLFKSKEDLKLVVPRGGQETLHIAFQGNPPPVFNVTLPAESKQGTPHIKLSPDRLSANITFTHDTGGFAPFYMLTLHNKHGNHSIQLTVGDGGPQVTASHVAWAIAGVFLLILASILLMVCLLWQGKRFLQQKNSSRRHEATENVTQPPLRGAMRRGSNGRVSGRSRGAGLSGTSMETIYEVPWVAGGLHTPPVCDVRKPRYIGTSSEESYGARAFSEHQSSGDSMGSGGYEVPQLPVTGGLHTPSVCDVRKPRYIGTSSEEFYGARVFSEHHSSGDSMGSGGYEVPQLPGRFIPVFHDVTQPGTSTSTSEKPDCARAVLEYQASGGSTESGYEYPGACGVACPPPPCPGASASSVLAPWPSLPSSLPPPPPPQPCLPSLPPPPCPPKSRHGRCLPGCPSWFNSPYVDMDQMKREQKVLERSGEPQMDESNSHPAFQNEASAINSKLLLAISFKPFSEDVELVNYEADGERSSSSSSSLLSDTLNRQTSLSSGPSSLTSGPTSMISGPTSMASDDLETGAGCEKSALLPAGPSHPRSTISSLEVSQVKMDEVMNSSTKALDYLASRSASLEKEGMATLQLMKEATAPPQAPPSYENVRETLQGWKPISDLTPEIPPRDPSKPEPAEGWSSDFSPRPSPPTPAAASATAAAAIPDLNMSSSLGSEAGQASTKPRPGTEGLEEKMDEDAESMVKPPVPPRPSSPVYLSLETGSDTEAPPAPPQPCGLLLMQAQGDSGGGTDSST